MMGMVQGEVRRIEIACPILSESVPADLEDSIRTQASAQESGNFPFLQEEFAVDAAQQLRFAHLVQADWSELADSVDWVHRRGKLCQGCTNLKGRCVRRAGPAGEPHVVTGAEERK